LNSSGKQVIALIPTHNHAILLEYSLKYLNRLNPNFDLYIFFENNSTDETLQIIKKFNRPKELVRLWFRPDMIKLAGNPHEAIGIARQTLLERARKINPDYAIFLDDDVVVFNEGFIDQITGRKKDIVGGPYLRDFLEGRHLASKWKRKGMKGIWFKDACMGFQEVYVTSAGCLCLSRKIIQDRRVNFMPITWNEKEKIAEDFGYCKRAESAGYKVYLDCAIKLGHLQNPTISPYKPWQVREDGKGYIDFEFH